MVGADACPAEWRVSRMSVGSSVRFSALAVTVVLAALVSPAAAVASDLAEAPAKLAKQAHCGTAKAAAAAGVARWLESCGTVNPNAAPETAARSAIAARAAQLGLRADGSDLAMLRAERTQRVNYVRFQQMHNGIPVFTGQVVVQYDRAGNVRLINNHTLPNLAVDARPAVAGAAALDVARAAVVGAENLRRPARQELVIYGGSGPPELVWHNVFDTRLPLASWHVMVSAHSGAILAKWNGILHDSGSGLTYDPNAVQQAGTTTFVDGNDGTTPALDAARVNLTLNHLNTGIQTLKGTYADATGTGVTGCNLPYTPGMAISATRVYDYSRDDDRFEEVLAYAAIDGVQSWIQSLGFTNVNNRSVPFDVHCVSEDNSFFDPFDGGLHMGDGGVDDGEDADVMIHEYGHSVQDNQVPVWGPFANTEQRAMGEGFGDFLAGMYYVAKGDATYITTYRYCIGEWDATSYNPVVGSTDGSGCLRWIDGTDESDGSDIGAYLGVPVEEHDDGRYWSAALTCVYEGMGADLEARDDITEIVIASHFSLTPDATTNAFEDAVDALLQADQDYLDGVNWQTIVDCALDRGLITSQPPLPECASAPFNDVPTSHAFCKEIKWMRDTGISTGFENGTYQPAADVTRQAMAAFMARLADATLAACSVQPFPDVPITNPFCPEIQWMKAEGISTGFGDGTYGPSLPVTRQAMSAFLARLADATLTPCLLPPFTDVPISHPFCQEIKWMKDNGISTGFGDGTYRPAVNVTRQAMSAFMFRVSDLLP
jgi:hypothetical protein